jgi:late competence protein required for DNA uptake (superfamily II DNA/RNA helicase)
MNKNLTKDDFNYWITTKLSTLAELEEAKYAEIDKIKENTFQLRQQLKCDHNCEVHVEWEHEYKAETYFCKKCKFELKF